MAEDTYFPGEGPQRLPEKLNERPTDVGVARTLYPEDASDGESLDIRAIWRIVWTRRYWILAAGALGLAIALAMSLLQTPLYRATVTLELNPPTVPILSGNGTTDDANMVVPNTDQAFLATQYGLLKSRNVAKQVVTNLNLVGNDGSASREDRIDARARSLASALQVEPIPTSRLVKLSYTSTQPADAARIANGFASAFMSSTLDRRFEATASARKFLQDRLESVRAALNQSERKLVEYAKRNNIIATGNVEGEGASNSLSSASLQALNTALATAQQKRIAAEQRYRQASNITEVQRGTSNFRRELARLEADYDEKSTYLKDDYPEMVRLRSRIDALKTAINSETKTVSGSLYAEYQAALAEEQTLTQRVRQLSANVLDERERSIQYNILKRELDTNRSLYDALLERYNEVGVAGGIGTPQASIVDRAQVPGSPFSPNIPLYLLVGLVLGLGTGVAAAFIYEFLTDTIKTPEDVREKLHVPVLGVIPKKRRKDDLSEQLADRKSAISESYSSLLTTLQFSTSEGLPRSLVVTSTKAAEGKSTTSFVLANNVAQLGKRVLLIDADMRRPSFIVEERADLGLSRLLVTNTQSREHILNTNIENMWLMPSGPVPPNPAQILNSPRLNQIIDSVSEMFDVVIVDAPPTHGFADAPLLASACKAVLLIVESGTTRRRFALEVLAKLQVSGSLVLGAALTKYQSTAGEYGYGYGYGYYDSYRSIEGRSQPHELTSQLMGKNEQE